MFPVRLLLCGPFTIELANQERPALRRKTRALLAYLAAADAAHSRRHLMTLFCAEAKNPPAVLRSLFSRLRRKLNANILRIDGEQVRLNPETCWVDYRIFREALSATHSADDAALAKILDLYRGEFLADLNLNDAPEFELWLLGERARCRSLYERGLTTVVSHFISAAEWQSAIQYAQRLVTENPLLEEAHGRLMWLYAQTGQIDAAKAQYQRCRELLAAELAVEPAAELQQLYADIRGGKVRPQFALTIPQPIEQLAVIPATTLIGRDAELAQLQQAWQQAQTGQGQVLLIEAEAGGGKTHLVHVFGRTLEATQFLYGEGYESAQSIPYTPWLELLELTLAPYAMEQLANLPRDVRTAVAQLIPAKSQLSEAPPLPTERLFAALAAFLLQDEPRFLFIDNLQWADQATLNLFHFLARRVVQAPVVLIGACRPSVENPPLAVLLDDLHQQAATLLPLAPLTSEEIVALLAAQWLNLPEKSRPQMATMLFAATAGNPLFITEIIRELAHTTAVPTTLPMPPSVLDLIMRRLRRFPASVQQVIESLAVLHAAGTPDLLHQISGRSEDETAVALDTALQQGLITVHEGETTAELYDFHHDLMRDAVILLLSKVRRRLLHKRTALALQPTVKAAVLAYHWRKAGNTIQESKYAVLAGADAYRVYANEQAADYFLHALKLDPQADTWRQLGDVYLRTGKWEQAERAYQEALFLAAEPTERSRAQYALGHLYTQRGHYDQALPLLDNARQYFATLPPSKELSEILNRTAIAYYWQGNYEQALNLYRESQSVAETIGDELAVASRICNIGLVYLNRGELAKAQQFLEESLQLCRQLDHQESIANRLGNLAVVHSRRGNYMEALRLNQEALGIDQSLGNMEAVVRHYENISGDYFHLENYQEAINYCVLALKIREDMKDQRSIAVNIGNLGILFHDLGEFLQAELCYRWALHLDFEAVHPEAVIRHLGNLGQNLIQQGALPLAKDFTERTLQLCHKWQSTHSLPPTLLRGGNIARQLGQIDKAIAFYEQAAEAARRYEQPVISASALAQLVPLLVNQKKMTSEEAKAQLQSLLANAVRSQKEQAFLRQALWQVTGEPAYARQAAQIYAALYSSAPLYDYRQRYFECTGEQLPVQPLPSFPNISLPENLPQIDFLLDQADRLLSST